MLAQRPRSLQPASMPLLDPDPVGSARVASAAPPEHYEAAVERAVERIRAGELDKVVLAREVRVHAPGRSTRRRCSTACATGSRRATATSSARRSWRSSAHRPSCSCAATAARADRRAGRHRAAAAPTPRSTTTSASSCCAAPKDREEQAIVDPPDRAHARAGERVGRRRRRAGAGEGPERPAPGHADPRPARGAAAGGGAGRPACTRRPPWAASRATRRCR